MSTLTAEQEQSDLKLLQLSKLLGEQILPDDVDLNTIECIHNLNGGEIYMTALQAFQYGKIQGIRSERARNKSRQRRIS